LKMDKKGYKPLVKVTSKNLSKSLKIAIFDNGIGIPPEIKDKIFNPFFTTKPNGKGTGLGLSLAYDIMKAHSGEIKAESELGKGATFTLTLPLS
jgi:two-component system NtrC family sensor kinase